MIKLRNRTTYTTKEYLFQLLGQMQAPGEIELPSLYDFFYGPMYP